MNAKLKTPTCSRCKSRKIRCNGKSPCFSCSKLSRWCEYERDVTESELPLRRGVACFECRRKKKVPAFSLLMIAISPRRKRCNGELPCQTCSVGRGEVHCAYPDGDTAIVPPGELQAIVVHRTTTSSSLSVSGQLSAFQVPVLPPTVTPPASFASLPDRGSNGDDDLHHHHPWLSEAVHGLNAATIMSRSPLLAESPLELFGPHSLSALSLRPLDTTYHANTSRTLFLNHRIQLGICVLESTAKALSEGLTDAGSLHPVLLHTTQLLGSMLARRLQYTIPRQRELEEEQTRRILNSFNDPDVKPCPVGYLQTCTLLSMYFCTQGDIVRAREMLVMGNTIVLKYNIDAMTIDPPSSSDATRDEFKPNPETQRGVAQAAPLAAPLSRPDILISRPNPSSEINFLRAKSAFLLIEAQLLATRWYRQQMDEQVAEQWQRSYWNTMDALQAHHSFLNLTLTKLIFNPDLKAVRLSLKVCTVMVLIARLALLSPFREQLDIRLKKCESMTEIINISKSFSEEDCRYLDPLLSVCWTATIEMLEQCIARGSEVALYDLPAMVEIIRQQNETLERVLPVTVAH
ncbi:hypothetical protein MVEN_02175400 [Mycena venus]|uniref:Zn(2)-C6 fungal-type domain-containing protein n=1 Tax=Mycena venus TaxID=2733690 RepID=A0A8H6X952_9AGAR|nr:hypothetical protein MVEN_02175400 [Mycena venus]